MSKRPTTRPPPAPKGEDPHVTIANLENHVSLLTQRCEDLVKARDREAELAMRYMVERDGSLTKLAREQGINMDLRLTIESMQRDISSLLGYKERVREEDRHRYGDLTEVNITGGNRG